MKLFKKKCHVVTPVEKELEEKNGEENSHGKAKNAERSTKKRILAFLRGAWRAITGCVRPRTYSPERSNSQEVPSTSGIDTAHGKAIGATYSITSDEVGEDRGYEKSSNDSCPQKPSPTVQISIDSFTYCKELGEGGFGTVHLATENITKEHVAIKVLEKDNISEWRQKSYVVERDILQLSSECPHLIHGLAAFQTTSFVFLVMELAPRGDLFDFIAENYPFDAASLQFMMASLICGVQFLHRKGILHRDLKPENVLVTAEGRLKITDFGLAITGIHDVTEDICTGTPRYAAPEMVYELKYGPGVDYFSSGAILFKMCTNSDAFGGADVREYEILLIYTKPDYPDFLSADTKDILEGLLCKDQHKRLGVNGDIKQHGFFSGIDWVEMEAGTAEPPASLSAAPTELDVKGCLEFYVPEDEEGAEDQDIFKDYSFVCSKWSNHYIPSGKT